MKGSFYEKDHYLWSYKSERPWTLAMDIPLFPTPPTLGCVATPVSDVIDIAKLTPISLSTVACARKHVRTKMHKTIGIHKIRYFINRTNRNLVYPKDKLKHRVTEFHITMTEPQKNNENEDDDDVVYAIGMANFY